MTGPREYARVAYYTKWAELDAGPDPKLKEQAGDVARIVARISDCTLSTRRIVDEIVPELSLPSSGGVPKMIRVLVTDVRPEKVHEYRELVKDSSCRPSRRAEQRTTP